MLPMIWSSGNVRLLPFGVGFNPRTLKFHRWLVAQPTMRPVMVIVLVKHLQLYLRLPQGRKQVHIEALIVHRSVETLILPVLPGAPGIDIQRLDLPLG